VTLPEIPDVLYDVVPDMLCGPLCGRTCNAKAAAVLEYVWPHMYATALRHAAARIDPPSEIVSDESKVDWSYWRGERHCADVVWRMADEAMSS